MASILENVFEVKDIDPEHGKKFDKVSRLVCSSVGSTPMEVHLDINSDIWPVEVKDRLEMLISTTLALGTDETDTTLLDKYDYAMSGRVFRFIEEGDQHSVYASFGGLLLKVKSAPHNISGFSLDQEIYILIRKV
ncbi:hypothetical protein P9112_008199 [Eukaryota sp. TZLM1-RC]